MSLTSHIREGNKSPIGRFFLERFSQPRSIITDVNRQLKNATTVRPAGQSPPYSMLGTAMDYRIRYSFAITPSDQLIASQGLWQLTFKEREHEDDIPIPDDELMDILSSHAGIFWSDKVEREGAVEGPYPWKVTDAFFHDLDADLAKIQPAGRRLDAKEEQLLARYCYVLALFEHVSRGGSEQDTGPLFVPAPKKSVQELLSIPQDEDVDDLCAMSWLFYDRCSDLLSQPAVLNPTFQGSYAVGGADADLVVDRCLMEIKTSIRSEITSAWIRQLAGYLILDYDDAYQIKSLGIYMARQGLLFTWPVEEFLQKLTGDPLASVAALRRDFRAQFSPGLVQHKEQETPGGRAAINIFGIERFDEP
jgi:hypothetical protein